VAITEEVRHRVYEAIRASHGDEVANGLMEMLPPVGWADVATKHDLDVLRVMLEERMDLRFQLIEKTVALEAKGVRHEFGERLERELRRQSVRFMTAMAAMFTAFGLIERVLLA